LPGCAGDLSALDPAGPAAARVADLWWIMLAGAMIILIGVTATALYAMRAQRGRRSFSSGRVLVGWGLVFPSVVLIALMALAFVRGEQLLARENPQVLTIDGHARQWAWTFDYPGGLTTTNALHVRAGEPFHVRLTSEDVIHSFWVPRLGGKVDAIPGKRNLIALQADQPGTYRATCAEYCGIGHAHMQFTVHAHAPGAFDAALAAAGEATPADRVLQPRRSPAVTAIARSIDYLLRWVGLR